METREHVGLKELAAAWLLSKGCRAVGTEVPCPIARFRVDAAGYTERAPRQGSTVIVECKASRADFMRDDLQVDALLRERDRLLARKGEIETELIPVHEPQLCRADEALFSQSASWDFERSRLLPYRRVLRDLARLEARLHGQTKFNLIARWRLADELWLLAPSGVVRSREVPPGWGLAECSAAVLRRGIKHAIALGSLPVRVVSPAPTHASPEARRQRLLRNIAFTLTRSVFPEPAPIPASQ
ncbi:MAG: hypothetical protein JNK53_01440 [Phycisphaerae bacterium]|nr:hypothetical protein [Phycisphaerae bacterium]